MAPLTVRFSSALPQLPLPSTDPAVKPVDANELVDMAIGLGILIGLSLVILMLTRLIVMPMLRRVIKRTRFAWDDVFLDAKMFQWLGYIPPAVVFCMATRILDSELIPLTLEFRSSVLDVLRNLSLAFIALCVLMAVNASLTAVHVLYSRREIARSRPIKGFVQLGKIFFAITGSICAVALIFGEQPWEFLKYTAGMTAVLLFVFKDTILSLVASLQLTSNNMIRVGDWIEVPGCGADGDVIDVALHTVKVRNFDKTIVTVPTRKLVEGAFKNWWGMQESGGRRIKRTIHIDMGTIRFLQPDDVQSLRKIELLRDYLDQKDRELAAANADRDVAATPLNARQLTNIGTFRVYVAAYLKSLECVHETFTFLVRLLEPGQVGLPLQIYLFTKTTNWIEYERIQADILDHLLAALPEFGLRVFQEPTGADVARSVVQRPNSNSASTSSGRSTRS